MAPERVITIALTESDWKALRSIQPEPVDWLKGKIRETIEQARQDAHRTAAGVAAVPTVKAH